MADEDGRAGRSAAWGVVAALFGCSTVATWLAAATPGSRFPAFPAYGFGVFPAYGFGVTAVTGLFLCFATLHDWWPTNRQHHRHELPPEETTPRPRPVGVGLGALLPPLPQGGLQVTLEEEKWDNWQHVAWIAELKFRITNTSGIADTFGHPIRLANFNLTSDPGDGERPPNVPHWLDQAQTNTLFHEIQRRRDTRLTVSAEHGPRRRRLSVRMVGTGGIPAPSEGSGQTTLHIHRDRRARRHPRARDP